MNYSDYPRLVVKDIIRLRRRIDVSGIPGKQVDHNLIIGTWNIRGFSRIYEKWTENPGSPKRNLRAMAYIAEIVRRFDVIAIQEVKRDTTGLRLLTDEFLGSNWGLIISDVSAGTGGNTERLSFIYDRRRVQPSRLSGEIVLSPTDDGNPVQQFDRTPYIVGFQCADERFVLVTAHIKYGDQPEDRLTELRRLAEYIAVEIRDRASEKSEENNLIVLGDFNIDSRGGNPLFQAFVSTGLIVPPRLLNLKTTYATEPKFYDQIAWFMGNMDLLDTRRAGVIDFAGAVFQEITLRQMSYRVSDHFPLWVEFLVDRSAEQMAQKLGVDSTTPNPFGFVTD